MTFVITECHLLSSLCSRFVDHQRNLLTILQEDRPAILCPFHREKECLASEILLAVLGGAASKEHSPPVTIFSLDKVSVTSASDRVLASLVKSALSEDRVTAVCHVWTKRCLTSIYHLTVPIACATLGSHEIIFSVHLIYMGSLTPDRFLLRTTTLIDYNLTFTDAFVSGRIKLHHSHSAVSGIFRFSIGSIIIIDDISLAILVEEECRIYALHFGKHDRIAPFAKRILRLDEEIAITYVRRYHIICLVRRIVGDSRSKDAAAHMLLLHIAELRRTAKYMTHLLPVDKIPAMEQGHPRIVGERGRCQEIVTLPVGAYRWVGIPAGKYRIIERALIRQRGSFVNIIIPLIREGIKNRYRALWLNPTC